nr:TetR family transcriptional regulator [Streptomyces coeruleorubidus]
MGDKGQQGRKPRADVQRNRAALLEAAQRHFLKEGVGASPEAVAKEAGVGPATLYRRTSPPGRHCRRPCCRGAPRSWSPPGGDRAARRCLRGTAAVAAGDGGVLQRLQRAAGTAHGRSQGARAGQPAHPSLR